MILGTGEYRANIHTPHDDRGQKGYILQAICFTSASCLSFGLTGDVTKVSSPDRFLGLPLEARGLSVYVRTCPRLTGTGWSAFSDQIQVKIKINGGSGTGSAGNTKKSGGSCPKSEPVVES